VIIMDNNKLIDAQSCINLMFKKPKTGENAFERNMRIAEKLRTYGPKTADLILQTLFQQKRAGKLASSDFFYLGSPIFHLIDILKELAESKHAHQIAEILTWDEIAEEKDRSKRVILLEILRQVGNISITPLLEEYNQKVKNVEYTNHLELSEYGEIFISASDYHKWDQEEVEEVIAACQQRK